MANPSSAELSAPAAREAQHFRNDQFGGYRRADGLFDIEGRMTDAKDAALADLVARAEALRADAVIGVHFDHDSIGGDSKTILMVSATGTAVRLG